MYLIQTKRVVDSLIRGFVCRSEIFNMHRTCNFNKCKTELNNDRCIIKLCGKNVGSKRLNPQVSNAKFSASCET